ncbi:pyroglutamyl-peptidase I [Opitutus sp. GAS368]|uniref:pyroglutamyl-peptidase I n=1 Tax=Opitutus sp. GAS368 TaxID=1882749 RepID=UPI00087C4B17|nr:pyroglutamyl-peptidase I [Opitutus sp. GAS368]SDR65622.1 pyroglutamyl-peptidase [Opitutus sp. GAS368]
MAKKSKTVLLTGFEPFGGESVNPSGEIARQLHGTVIAGHRVVGALLPCVFGAAIAELKKQIRATKPVLVICTGQAGGRAEITPERVAINVDDARIADNAGRQPVDRPIVRGGPAAYWSSLPIKAITEELRRRGIPATVSQTAGTFVCNHVFYGLMHALQDRKKVRGGFIHVPFLPEQAKPGQPSLPLDTMTAAIAVVLAVALKIRRDVRVAGGATH